jgi:cholesterol transport system auxiliary component
MNPAHLRLPVVLLSFALLAGCSILGGRAPDRIYVLNAATAATTGEPVAAVLSVPRPLLQPGLDTDRIALVRPGNELDFYAASRFGEPLPKVLSALVLQSMGGAGGFVTAVGTDRAGLPSDFELLLTVRRFEAEYLSGVSLPSVQVAIDCMLVNSAPRRVLGRCDGSATEPAAEDRMGEIVLAMERGVQKALAQVREKSVALARTALAAREAARPPANAAPAGR